MASHQARLLPLNSERRRLDRRGQLLYNDGGLLVESRERAWQAMLAVKVDLLARLELAGREHVLLHGRLTRLLEVP